MEGAISISAHTLSVVGTVGSVIAVNNEINNFFTDRGMGDNFIGSGDEQAVREIFGGWGTTKELGSHVTVNEMNAIFPNANQGIVKGFVRNFNEYSGHFGITNYVSTAQFLAQAGVETWNGFQKLSEVMDYSSVAGLKSNYKRLFINGPIMQKIMFIMVMHWQKLLMGQTVWGWISVVEV